MSHLECQFTTETNLGAQAIRSIAGHPLSMFAAQRTRSIGVSALLVILLSTACVSPSPEQCIKPIGTDGALMFACRSHPFPSCRGTSGERLGPDTAFTWLQAAEGSRREIEAELRGIRPPKVYATQSELNRKRVDHLLRGENGDRYVRYFLEERRKAGLPEIEGLPENWEQKGQRCATPHRDQLRYPYPDYYYRMDELGWPQTQTVHDD